MDNPSSPTHRREQHKGLLIPDQSCSSRMWSSLSNSPTIVEPSFIISPTGGLLLTVSGWWDRLNKLNLVSTNVSASSPHQIQVSLCQASVLLFLVPSHMSSLPLFDTYHLQAHILIRNTTSMGIFRRIIYKRGGVLYGFGFQNG